MLMLYDDALCTSKARVDRGDMVFLRDYQWESAIANTEKSQIDHIIPRAAKLPSWPSWTKQAFKAFKESIGNLTVVSTEVNRTQLNRPLEKKLEHYW